MSGKWRPMIDAAKAKIPKDAICFNTDLSDLPGEEWKPVPDFPKYLVSNMGRVKNSDGMILKQAFNALGKAMVGMGSVRNGTRKTKQVSRMVLLAFHPIEMPQLFQACHINNIDYDNRLCNLTWGTHKENMQHKVVLHGTSRPGAENHKAKLTDEDVRFIYTQRKHFDVPRKVLCDQFNVSAGTLSAICQHKTWRHLKLWEIE